MISRYALYSTDKLRDRFAPGGATPKGVKPHYNISPGQRVPIIVWRDGAPAITQMIWGFIPVGAKDSNSIFRYKTYVARSEKILDTHTFRTALRSTRCIIPINGFYEWKRNSDSKRPFYISSKTEDLIGLAGIYSEWTDQSGVMHNICAIVTIDSDTENDMIPSNLPVIVNKADEAAWCDPTVGDLSTLFSIIRPYDSTKLSIIPVSDAVNSTKVDGLDLIKRA